MRVEVPVNQIAGRLQPIVAGRGSRSPAATDPLQPAAFISRSTRLAAGMDARSTIGLFRCGMDLPDAFGQITIGH